MQYEHLSAISALTADGRVVFSLQPKAFNAEDVVTFLKKLKRKLGGKLLVIWDGASIHRAQAIKTYLAKGATKYLQLEQLPAYAPELNPDEGVWHCLKAALANRAFLSLGELHREVQAAATKLARRHSTLLALVAHAGFSV